MWIKWRRTFLITSKRFLSSSKLLSKMSCFFAPSTARTAPLAALPLAPPSARRGTSSRVASSLSPASRSWDVSASTGSTSKQERRRSCGRRSTRRQGSSFLWCFFCLWWFTSPYLSRGPSDGKHLQERQIYWRRFLVRV